MTSKIHECIVDDLWGIEFEGLYFGTAHLWFSVGDVVQVRWINRAYNRLEVRPVASNNRSNWGQAIFLGDDPVGYRAHVDEVAVKLYGRGVAA